MKVWILLALLIVGCVTFEVRADDDYDDDITEEGSSVGDNDDDENDDSGVNNSDEGDEDTDYVIEDHFCGHFNLEICIYGITSADDFQGPDSDDPLCWESYTAMQCMHDYAKACFPDDEQTEDYLCKLRNFQDRIQLLCRNETEVDDDDEAALEEAMKCLEEAEEDAEECVAESVPKIKEMVKGSHGTAELTDLDTLKCLIASHVMECVIDRLKTRCDEDIVEAFREGAEEGIAEVLGDVCKEKDLHDIISLK